MGVANALIATTREYVYAQLFSNGEGPSSEMLASSSDLSVFSILLQRIGALSFSHRLAGRALLIECILRNRFIQREEHREQDTWLLEQLYLPTSDHLIGVCFVFTCAIESTNVSNLVRKGTLWLQVCR